MRALVLLLTSPTPFQSPQLGMTRLSQVSLQEVLTALGGPLKESSLLALLSGSHKYLESAIKDHTGKDPNLLITPESTLLSHGGNLQFLQGIPGRKSNFTAPEFKNKEEATAINLEKCYIYSLGMTLVAAMQNELEMMVPQVSEEIQSLFRQMTDDNSNMRPNLEEVAGKIVKYFNSESEAIDEMDRIVEYVLGTSLERSSEFGDDQIDEANLEAEFQQVMSMRGTGSIEHLYPPSYGSRASSSLSLGSSSGYMRSIGIKARDFMYSSLPMVSTHDANAKQSQLLSSSLCSPSDDHLVKDGRSQPKAAGKQVSIEPKVCYGSHLYTPSRRRKPEAKPKKYHLGDVDHIKSTSPKTTFHRSSSDGHKANGKLNAEMIPNTRSMHINDMPPLRPKSTDSTKSGRDDHELPLSPHHQAESTTQKEKFNPSASRASDLISSHSLETKEVASSDNSNDNIKEEFDFPSPPPVPLEICNLSVEVSFTSSLDGVETSQSNDSTTLESTKELPKDSVSNLESSLPEEGMKPLFNPEPLVNDDDSTNHCPSSSECQIVSPVDHKKSEGSLKKLSRMFGPEFSTIKGIKEGTNKVMANVPSDRRVVDVIMLNGCRIQFTVELSSTCRELFSQVVAHQDLEETHIFGLAIIKDAHDHGDIFLEFDRKLKKYAPKGWASYNISPSPRFVLFFRVKFYVENVNQLRLSRTRHLYYSQLRIDIQEAKTYCHEQSALKLAAYAIQAEKGDHKHTDCESCLKNTKYYLSPKVISKLGEEVIKGILPGMHSELKGQSREAAELHFLQEAQTLPEYGMVFYKVAREKRGAIGLIWLGLSVRGIVIYNVHKGIKTPTSHLSWKSIKNLSRANRKFILETEGQTTHTFYTESYKKARYLLHLSINYHRFQLLPREPPEFSMEPFYLPITVVDTNMDDKDQVAERNQTQQPLDSKKMPSLPEGTTLQHEIEKKGGIIGLRLAGGRGKTYGAGFVYIKSLMEGSVAARTGEIQEKDILLKVDGKSVWGMTHREAASLISKSHTTIILLTLHRPIDSKWLFPPSDHHLSESLKRDESSSDLKHDPRT